MAYVDVNTPVIEKITLPSGNTYYIADREVRDVVDTLSQAVAGGVAYIIAFDGNSTPDVTKIPAGVKVKYNDTEYTGTLAAEAAQAGAFYLVKSSTQQTGSKDVYDEYVPVGDVGSKAWEKIGDTQIDLSGIVTDVQLDKSTDTVIGSDATFSVTQPTITMQAGQTGDVDILTDSTTKYLQATATGTNVTATTSNISATATGAAVDFDDDDSVTVLTGLGTPTTSTVLTGAKPVENASAVENAVSYVKEQGSAITTKLSASVDLGTATTDTAVKTITPTTEKLAVTEIVGIGGSSNQNVVASRTTQTTADGTGTASTTNTDWLKGVSVSNGALVIGAATMDTQTTYSADAPQSVAIPTAASAKTVATGSVTTTGDGADIVTGVTVGSTVNAVTGYAAPTATIATGSTGDVTVATGIGAATVKYMSIGSNGTASAVTGYTPTTDTVVGTDATFTTTQPTVSLATGATAGAGVVSVATGIGTVTQPTISIAAEDSTAAGRAAVITGVTKEKASATATGGATTWNNKDEVTVLTSATDVDVTKG